MGRQPTLVVRLFTAKLTGPRGPMSKSGCPELSEGSWALGCIFSGSLPEGL